LAVKTGSRELQISIVFLLVLHFKFRFFGWIFFRSISKLIGHAILHFSVFSKVLERKFFTPFLVTHRANGSIGFCAFIFSFLALALFFLAQ